MATATRFARGTPPPGAWPGRRPRRRWLLAAFLAGVWFGGGGAAAAVDDHDLTAFSLEDLMEIEVTSVAKREQRLTDAPAAVYVLTREDLRRAGITSIPEALRMVPGLQVAQIDANKWAISARGFNSRFANKMLVLIDGRSIYTPLFAGTFWNLHDAVLEDIDRIEVIRGPGATLWGANAVNGVINIITRPAGETQGGVVEALLGSEERGNAGVRYGGRLGDRGHYRVYGKYFQRDAFVTPGGDPAADDWDVRRSGGRIDLRLPNDDLLTVQGDVYDGRAGKTVSVVLLGPPYARNVEDELEFRGSHLLARWRRALSGGSETTLQLFVDRTERDELYGSEDRETVDLDFQHHWRASKRRELVWGAGFRRSSDRIVSGTGIAFDPPRRSDDLFHGFVQQELALGRASRVRLILGSKLEHNEYTGWEVQPNLRAAWAFREGHTLWGAVSRAIRSPARIHDDLRAHVVSFPSGTPGLAAVVTLMGNREFRSEVLRAWELGVRAYPTDRWYVDVAAFYNVYDDLQTVERGAPFVEPNPVPHVVVPYVFDNLRSGSTRGLEIAASWRSGDRLSVSGGYAWLDMNLTTDPASTDDSTILDPEANPEHTLQLRIHAQLPRDVSAGAGIYVVDDLRPHQDISGYTRLDVWAAWSPRPVFEASVAVLNLLDERHAEFEGFLALSTEVERSFHGRLAWRF